MTDIAQTEEQSSSDYSQTDKELIKLLLQTDLKEVEKRHRSFIRQALLKQKADLNLEENSYDVPDKATAKSSSQNIKAELKSLKDSQVNNTLTQDEKHKAHLKSILPNFKLVVSIFALTAALLPFCIDMYLSSFPAMAEELQVPITSIELTLSLFFVGIALGQLFWGPLSDSFGRKIINVIAFVFVVITSATIGIVSSLESIEINRLLLIYILRFIQGLFCAAILVNSTSILRDIYNTKEFVRVNGLVTLIFFMAPFFAPLLGTYVSQAFSWHYIFFTIAILSAISGFLYTYYIPETINPEFKRKLQFKETFKTMSRILKDGPSLWLILMISSSSCVIFAYVSMSSNVYQSYYNIPQTLFPYLFMFNIIGQIILNMFNTRMVKYYDPRTLLLFGVIWFAIAGILNMTLALLGGGFYAILFGCMISMSGNALVFTNAFAIFLEKHYRNSGTASSLVNVSRWIIPAVMTALVTHIDPHQGHTMLFTIGLFSFGITVTYGIYYYYESRHKQKAS